MLTSPRNFLVSNVELNWARLDQPVSPFGAAQWELQIATTAVSYTHPPSPRDS